MKEEAATMDPEHLRLVNAHIAGQRKAGRPVGRFATIAVPPVDLPVPQIFRLPAVLCDVEWREVTYELRPLFHGEAQVGYEVLDDAGKVVAWTR